MRGEYDLRSLNPRPNPYAKERGEQIVLNLTPEVLEYFKSEADKAGVFYQAMVGLYLLDCVKNNRHIEI